MNNEIIEQLTTTEDKKQPLKATSFRLSEETTATFKAISNEIGGNPQETLSKLIEVYKLQANKAHSLDSGRKSEIERVERYTGGIISSFIGLVEELTTMEDSLRGQYSEEITQANEKATTLQELLENSDKKNEALQNEVKTLTEELMQSKEEIERLKVEAQNVVLTQALTQALERMGATVPATEQVNKPVKEKKTPK
ncbi:MAG: hypothetical protein R3Y63_14155 [Eubacteriales bacterium]